MTSKDRQYDLRAEIVDGICTLKLAVECKNLKANFPLLISRVPRMMSESYHEVILGRRNSTPIEGADIFRAKQNQIFRSKDPVGKSATQVGRGLQEGKIAGSQVISSDSETYDKWSQAIASSYELIEKAGHSSLGGSDTVNATVVLPVLIVPNETLWVADYSSDGQLLKAPYQCEECSLFLEKRVPTGYITYTISHLLIFTTSGFDAHLDKITNNRSDEWEYLFPENRQFANYERSGMVAHA